MECRPITAQRRSVIFMVPPEAWDVAGVPGSHCRRCPLPWGAAKVRAPFSRWEKAGKAGAIFAARKGLAIFPCRGKSLAPGPVPGIVVVPLVGGQPDALDPFLQVLGDDLVD